MRRPSQFAPQEIIQTQQHEPIVQPTPIILEDNQAGIIKKKKLAIPSLNLSNIKN